MGSFLISREAILLYALGVIFNAGGIVWLVLAHLPQTNRRLLRLETNSTRTTADIAWIRGRMSATGRKR